MAVHDVGAGNLGDLNSVAAGDTVVLRGIIPGLSFSTTGRDGVTFVSHELDSARLLGNGMQHAFHGNGRDLSLLGLEITGYAPGRQRGAIQGHGTFGWTVEDCDVHHNGKGTHGFGLRLGNRMTVRRSRFNDNGAMGMSGVGDDILVEDVEVARNNWAADWSDAEVEAWLLSSAGRTGGNRFPGTYDGGDSGQFFIAGDYAMHPGHAFAIFHYWEGGGSKLVKTNRLVARRVHVHHNGGRGWWPDIENRDGYTEDLTSEWNAAEGFTSEIGYAWNLAHATLRYNGMGDRRGWLWGPQGLFQNCSDNVASHVLAVSRGGANGWAQVNQGRTPRSARNVLRDSVIVYETADGRHGWVSDSDGGEALRWERVRVVAADGGSHVSSHGLLLPGGEGPRPEDVGARALPNFGAPSPPPPVPIPNPEPEPTPVPDTLEERVALADEHKANGDAALDTIETRLATARLALDQLYALAITPIQVEVPVEVPFDFTTADDAALVAEKQRIDDEVERRLIEQS